MELLLTELVETIEHVFYLEAPRKVWGNNDAATYAFRGVHGVLFSLGGEVYEKVLYFFYVEVLG